MATPDGVPVESIDVAAPRRHAPRVLALLRRYGYVLDWREDFILTRYYGLEGHTPHTQRQVATAMAVANRRGFGHSRQRIGALKFGALVKLSRELRSDSRDPNLRFEGCPECGRIFHSGTCRTCIENRPDVHAPHEPQGHDGVRGAV